MNDFAAEYDSEDNLTSEKRKIARYKFPPEYTHIIGVPFKMFKGGKSGPPPPPVGYKHIAALPERQVKMEIVFPNVAGYRIEHFDGEIKYDFNPIEN